MADGEKTTRSYGIDELKTETGFFKLLFNMHDIGQERCLQCVVVEKKDNGFIVVQPIVKRRAVIQGGTKEISRAKVTVRPIRLCHGGYSIQFPITIGDTGWIIAGDRSAKKAMDANSAVTTDPDAENSENGNEELPDDNGILSFAYGFFIPDCWAEEIPLTTDDNASEFAVSFVGNKEKPTRISIKKDESVRIESNGNTFTVDKDGLKYDGTKKGPFNMLNEIRYDASSHQFQAKTSTYYKAGDITVDCSEPSDWKLISGGQAEPIPEE